jgi:hypothetical protein
VGKQIGERRRTGAHRRRQIWPEELAGAAVSNDEIHRSEIISRGEEKGVEGGDRGGFIGGSGVREGVGLRLGAMDGWGRRRARPGLLDGGRGNPDGRAPLVSGWRARTDTLSGLDEIGPGPILRLGRFGPPWPFSLFLILFHFPFPAFCFISNLLQKCFKSIQTSFKKILKLSTLF